jgi:hypothetical protein
MENHAGVKPSLRIDSFPAHKVKELSRAARKILAAAGNIDAEILQCIQRMQWNDRKRKTGGDGLDGRTVVEVRRA